MIGLPHGETSADRKKKKIKPTNQQINTALMNYTRHVCEMRLVCMSKNVGKAVMLFFLLKTSYLHPASSTACIRKSDGWLEEAPYLHVGRY